MLENLTVQDVIYYLLSVVLVSFIINILSNYVFKKLDIDFANWRKSRSERLDAQKQKRIEDLAKSDKEQIRLAFYEMRLRSMANYLMISMVLWYLVMSNLANINASYKWIIPVMATFLISSSAASLFLTKAISIKGLLNSAIEKDRKSGE